MTEINRSLSDKPFWLFFLKDPATGSVHCTGYGHNAIADYRGNPYFVGMKRIEVKMEDLAQ